MLISTFFADCPRDSEQESILGLFYAILLDRRHVTKYGKPQGVVRETNLKPVRDSPGALGWRRGS